MRAVKLTSAKLHYQLVSKFWEGFVPFVAPSTGGFGGELPVRGDAGMHRVGEGGRKPLSLTLAKSEERRV